jgi:hypothetical protein
MPNKEAVVIAARRGLDAWAKDQFGDQERSEYISSLQDVLSGLGSVVADPTVREFLGSVIEAELQAAPHIEVASVQ